MIGDYFRAKLEKCVLKYLAIVTALQEDTCYLSLYLLVFNFWCISFWYCLTFQVNQSFKNFLVFDGDSTTTTLVHLTYYFLNLVCLALFSSLIFG